MTMASVKWPRDNVTSCHAQWWKAQKDNKNAVREILALVPNLIASGGSSYTYTWQPQTQLHKLYVSVLTCLYLHNESAEKALVDGYEYLRQPVPQGDRFTNCWFLLAIVHSIYQFYGGERKRDCYNWCSQRWDKKSMCLGRDTYCTQVLF